ncbi:GM26750 [Drosophila sechellia]|uniref:GM26750 n=1 Tax=Drosophila sechellia TaxID=7238 RepID=B4IQ91_DROSE|nr:GM26750 [Drosophila sechellia]
MIYSNPLCSKECEITLEPNAIEAHPVLESHMLPYPTMSVYTQYSTAQNSFGVTPFQPTGDKTTAYC